MKAINKKNEKKGKEVIRLENVCKVYNMGEGVEVTAICGVNFVVEEGDFACVLGPSGSGKSTLLHIMGLLDTPTSGKVYIDGIETTKMSPDEQASIRGEKIGFVFQMFNLINSMKAWENAAVPLTIRGVPLAEREKRAKELLTQLGLGDRLDHYPSQLSGGQRQRVAIARALINNPAVILADEPTGNLDSKTGKEVIDILVDLNKKGRTIVLITHDNSLTKIAKKIWRIKDGKLQNES
ncbi:MAG: ABC transporter ATP-binding protein [Candidatus Bilamarchaeaceae archaeon]